MSSDVGNFLGSAPENDNMFKPSPSAKTNVARVMGAKLREVRHALIKDLAAAKLRATQPFETRPPNAKTPAQVLDHSMWVARSLVSEKSNLVRFATQLEKMSDVKMREVEQVAYNAKYNRPSDLVYAARQQLAAEEIDRQTGWLSVG